MSIDSPQGLGSSRADIVDVLHLIDETLDGETVIDEAPVAPRLFDQDQRLGSDHERALTSQRREVAELWHMVETRADQVEELRAASQLAFDRSTDVERRYLAALAELRLERATIAAERDEMRANALDEVEEQRSHVQREVRDLRRELAWLRAQVRDARIALEASAAPVADAVPDGDGGFEAGCWDDDCWEIEVDVTDWDAEIPDGDPFEPTDRRSPLRLVDSSPFGDAS